MTDDDASEAARVVIAATFLRGQLVFLQFRDTPLGDLERVDSQLAEILISPLDDALKSRAIWQVVGESPEIAEQLTNLRSQILWADTSPPGEPGPVESTIWTCPVARDIRVLQQFPGQDMGDCPTHGARLVRETG